ncbi:hypothetical protein KJ742_01900, partial [Patescibacteria group bacterium]|nr:hypothetical protein [Patescibacteria group bacterium]
GSYTFTTVDAAGNESEGTAVPVEVIYEVPTISDFTIDTPNGEIWSDWEHDVHVETADAESFQVILEADQDAGTTTPASGSVNPDGTIDFTWDTAPTGSLEVTMKIILTGPGGTKILVTDCQLNYPWDGQWEVIDGE